MSGSEQSRRVYNRRVMACLQQKRGRIGSFDLVILRYLRYSTSMLTEGAQVDSSSTSQLEHPQSTSRSNIQSYLIMTRWITLQYCYPISQNEKNSFFFLKVRSLISSLEDHIFSRPCTARKCSETLCCNFWGVKQHFNLTSVPDMSFGWTLKAPVIISPPSSPLPPWPPPPPSPPTPHPRGMLQIALRDPYDTD